MRAKVATPAQLVEALSDATGVAPATVTDIDRKLVAAGLRTKGGRGLSAARMTTLDAARLLAAILAGPQANQSAEAVRRYGATLPDPKRSSDGLFSDTGCKGLSALSARHNFVEALAAVIASAATGALRKMRDAEDDEQFPKIEVFAFTRATYGRIHIFGLPNGRAINIEYLPTPSSKRASAKAAPAEGDLEQSRRITERTIFTIAELLAEGNGDEQR
jgi:hypothetical protein